MKKSKKKKSRQIRLKYLLIFASAFLDFTQKLLSFFFVQDVKDNYWIVNMICLSIFSYFILKSKLYIHQRLSLYIMIILGIILNIIINLQVKYNKRIVDKLYEISLSFIIELFFSLPFVINKYAMEYCYALSFEITFYQGLFGFIAFSILLIISTNMEIKSEKYKDFINIEYNGKKYIDNLFDYTDKIDIKKLIAFIVMMITRLML